MENIISTKLFEDIAEKTSIRAVIKFLGDNDLLALSCRAYKNKDEMLLNKHYKVLKEICKLPLSGVVVSYLSQGWIIDCLERLATNDYHKKALLELVSGNKIGAFCLTEVDHGSSYRNMKTLASIKDGKFSINGAKNYITNGNLADYYVVAARMDGKKDISLFLLERGLDGFSVNIKDTFLGNVESGIAYLEFNCKDIDEKYLLGRIGTGAYMLPKCLNFERMDLSLYAIFLSEVVLEDTIKFLNNRSTEENNLLNIQVIRNKLVEMYSDKEILKEYVISTTKKILNKEEMSQNIIRSKIKATELAKDIILKCAQLCGGYGFTQDSGIIRKFNDITPLTIGGGSNDVLRNALYKSTIIEIMREG